MKVKAETTSTSFREADISKVFKEMVDKVAEPVVLELGAKQAIQGKSSMHRDWIPHAKGYYGTDIQSGDDVDLVADLHEISGVLKRQKRLPKKFDLIISGAVFEHVLNPFVAMREVAKCMKRGGMIFVAVPSTFPIHSFPNDYWRFTVESLSFLMRHAGLEVIDAAYQGPAKITSTTDPNVEKFQSFLMVSCIARKPGVFEKYPMLGYLRPITKILRRIGIITG